MKNPAPCKTCKRRRRVEIANAGNGYRVGFVCPFCGEFTPVSQTYPTKADALECELAPHRKDHVA